MKKLLSLTGLAALAAGVGYVLRNRSEKVAPVADAVREKVGAVGTMAGDRLHRDGSQDGAGTSDDLALAQDLLDEDDVALDEAEVEPDLGPVDQPVEELVQEAQQATGDQDGKPGQG